MDNVGRFIGAALAALLLGFGVGEFTSPAPAAAVASGCDYAICDFPGYGCHPNPNEINCISIGDSCESEVCEDPCDPEEDEDCEGPVD